MKQIRHGVFETNSSSTHSITMCMKSDYDAWEHGELYWNRWGGNFVTKEFVEKEIEELRELFRRDYPDYIQGDEEWEEKFRWFVNDDKQYYTHKEFYDYEFIDYETFADTFKTPSGEEIVSFGYYGNDY